MNIVEDEELYDNEKFGKKLFHALKHLLYKALCPSGRAKEVIFDHEIISKNIISVLTAYGISSNPIVGSTTALILLFGIDYFCSKNKPKTIAAFEI